jgi:hypothetical protein
MQVYDLGVSLGQVDADAEFSATFEPHLVLALIEAVRGKEEGAARAESMCDRASVVPIASEPPLSAGWQDISTAPRDGATVLVAHAKNGAIFTASWDEEVGGWIDGETNLYGEPLTYSPSHWMPPPPPPAESSPSGAQQSELTPQAPDSPKKSSDGGEK